MVLYHLVLDWHELPIPHSKYTHIYFSFLVLVHMFSNSLITLSALTFSPPNILEICLNFQHIIKNSPVLNQHMGPLRFQNNLFYPTTQCVSPNPNVYVFTCLYIPLYNKIISRLFCTQSILVIILTSSYQPDIH